MAKVTAPLMSISASGKVGCAVFETHATRTIAKSTPTMRGQFVSPAQAVVRQSCRDAADAWALLSAPERAEWAAIGISYRFESNRESNYTVLNGWTLWLREWMLQQCTPALLPLLPNQRRS